jgi:oxalate decarboxylase/phosphoglucose isomerase-like protein (cupin superfamily)
MEKIIHKTTKQQQINHENSLDILYKEQNFTKEQTKVAQDFTMKLNKTEFNQRLEEMALTSCDMITLKRLMGVVRC